MANFDLVGGLYVCARHSCVHACFFTQAWPDVEPSAGDAILLVKQYMHSTRLSQMPVVFTPEQLSLNLGGRGPTTCRKRQPFVERREKEYRRTADVVSKSPWLMTTAAQYLRELCDRTHKDADPYLLPTIDFVQRGVRCYETLLPNSLGQLHEFAPQTPKMILVEAPFKKRRVNQKVSAKALAGLAPKPPANKLAADTAPAGIKLGCSKCRYSARGCKQCKAKAEKQAQALATAAAASSSGAGMMESSGYAGSPGV